MKIRRIAPALLAIAISGYGLYNVAGEDVKAIFNDYKEKFSMESDIDTFVTEDKPEIIDKRKAPETLSF